MRRTATPAFLRLMIWLTYVESVMNQKATSISTFSLSISDTRWLRQFWNEGSHSVSADAGRVTVMQPMTTPRAAMRAEMERFRVCTRRVTANAMPEHQAAAVDVRLLYLETFFPRPDALLSIPLRR